MAFGRKFGMGVAIYLLIKWTVLASLAWWLSRFDWFELHYLLVVPVVMGIALLTRVYIARGKTKSL